MRTPLLLLCAALALPARSQADNTADEADLAFALGNQSYAHREYDKALASYFLSLRLVPNANVLFNIARCYEALEKLDEAYRYYRELANAPGLRDSDRRGIDLALARLARKTEPGSLKTPGMASASQLEE